MPSKPRSEIFDPDTVGVYHCFSRCVRSEHLCGFDTLTGNDYGYRRQWIMDRLRELAGSMALDVLDFAALGNHLHAMLRNRPDIVKTWLDEEVARRWWDVCPGRRNADGSPKEPTQSEMDAWIKEPGKIDQLRARLSDISWFMRLLLQPIAKRANKEDDKKGRFFAERFGCSKLEDESALLACSMYIALNPVRAKLVDRPENYCFTSAYARIKARQTNFQKELGVACDNASTHRSPDAWLAPVFLEQTVPESGEREENQPNLLVPEYNPRGSARLSNKGFLPISLDEYLATLDWTGRQIRTAKAGRIPNHLAPIFQRLGIAADKWIGVVKHFSYLLTPHGTLAEPTSFDHKVFGRVINPDSS